MARFQCRACGQEGSFTWPPPVGRKCPRCGSISVRYAAFVVEFKDDDPIVKMVEALAEDFDDDGDETLQ
jgi:hypothetical protein